MKFWTISGRNAKSIIGSTGGKSFVSQFCSVYVDNMCITGAGDGNLY